MMAKSLASAGAVVYIVGRRRDVLERAAEQINVRRLISRFSSTLAQINELTL